MKAAVASLYSLDLVDQRMLIQVLAKKETITLALVDMKAWVTRVVMPPSIAPSRNTLTIPI